MADDPVQLIQLLIADKRPDLAEHDQMISKDHAPQKLHNHPLKDGQLLHIPVSGNIHSDILQKRLHLRFQKAGPDQLLVEPLAQHKILSATVIPSTRELFAEMTLIRFALLNGLSRNLLFLSSNKYIRHSGADSPEEASEELPGRDC